MSKIMQPCVERKDRQAGFCVIQLEEAGEGNQFLGWWPTQEAAAKEHPDAEFVEEPTVWDNRDPATLNRL